jgi:hypothetical protein
VFIFVTFFSQSIPLFPTLLKSSSVNFKADRLWMLQLLYAGSNLADDAMICKRGSVLELSLAFCSSAVSDSESKRLILQVRLVSSLAYIFDYRMWMMMHLKVLCAVCCQQYKNPLICLLITIFTSIFV